MAGGRHHGIGPLMGRFDGAFHAAPTLDHGTFWEPPFQDLVPSHDAPSFRREVVADFVDEPRLQFRFIRNAFLSHAALASFAICPANLGHLVPSDVNDLRRKQVANFIHHGLEKPHGRVAARAVHVLEYAPVVGHIHLLTRASQPRVGRQRRAAMARQLNFWNHLNVPFRRVFDDVTHVLSRVKPTMHSSIRLGSKSTHLRQLRISLDGKAPSLVFRQVPVQHIHLLQRECIDDALHEGRLHEVPATIQEQAAMCQVRMVFDLDRRQHKASGTALLASGRQDLAQRRPTSKGTFLVLRLNDHPIRFNPQDVPFQSQRTVRTNPRDSTRRLPLCGLDHVEATFIKPIPHGLHPPTLGPRNRERALATKPTPSHILTTCRHRLRLRHQPRQGSLRQWMGRRPTTNRQQKNK